MKFENYTSSTVNIVNEKGKILISFRSKGDIRVKNLIKEEFDIAGLPCIRVEYDGIQGLPEPSDGIMFIVSLDVLLSDNGRRTDLVSPDFSSGSIVLKFGYITGVRRFRKF